MGQNWPKPLKIGLGDGRTFAVELEMFGQADAKLREQEFLFCRRLGNAAQTDLAAVGGGKDDVCALQGGKQRDRPHWRH